MTLDRARFDKSHSPNKFRKYHKFAFPTIYLTDAKLIYVARRRRYRSAYFFLLARFAEQASTRKIEKYLSAKCDYFFVDPHT